MWALDVLNSYHHPHRILFDQVFKHFYAWFRLALPALIAGRCPLISKLSDILRLSRKLAM